MSTRAWLVAALVAIFCILVVGACSNIIAPPVTPQGRGIMQPRGVGDDVAAGKTVWCSSNWGAQGCAAAVDGNDGTAWSSDWVAFGGANANIRVDLTADVYIASVSIIADRSGSYKCGQFTLAKSSDNSSWTDVTTVADGTMPITASVNDTARYWRLLCPQAQQSTYGTWVNTWKLLEGSSSTATPAATATATETNTPTATFTPWPPNDGGPFRPPFQPPFGGPFSKLERSM